MLLFAMHMSLGVSERIKLVHTTALAIVPPEGVCWQPIQAERESLRDGGLFRWPPHINVFFPFVEPAYFAHFAEAAAPALAASCAFRLRLERFGTFGSAKRGVVWLEPRVVPDDPNLRGSPLVDMHERLRDAMPIDTTFRSFVPHLTLTHTQSDLEAREIADRLTAEWTEAQRRVEFEVTELAILCRNSETAPFHLAWRLPLGVDAAPPRADSRAFESMPTPSSTNWRPRQREGLHAKIRARANL